MKYVFLLEISIIDFIFKNLFCPNLVGAIWGISCAIDIITHQWVAFKTSVIKSEHCFKAWCCWPTDSIWTNIDMTGVVTQVFLECEFEMLQIWCISSTYIWKQFFVPLLKSCPSRRELENWIVLKLSYLWLVWVCSMLMTCQGMMDHQNHISDITMKWAMSVE